MILIDNNQLLIANIFSVMKHYDIEDEGILRHLCINTYRIYNKKFKEKYGEMIICHDSPHCWRKDVFKHYKENRKSNKEKSPHDWNKIFKIMTKIRKEVDSSFPWKNISVPTSEADDIIAVIVKNSIPIEPIIIISSDKDFQQLQKYSNVKQWSPLKGEYINCENPDLFLKEHIIKGDASDGVPNIISDDDTFVDKDKRQTPLTKKKMINVMENTGEYNKTDEWCRNETLIDFNKIPKELENKIIEEYNKPNEKSNKGIFPYLVKYQLVKLLETVEELY